MILDRPELSGRRIHRILDYDRKKFRRQGVCIIASPAFLIVLSAWAGATQLAMMLVPEDQWLATAKNSKSLYRNNRQYLDQLSGLEKARGKGSKRSSIAI